MEKIEQIVLFDENGDGVWVADLVRCKDCKYRVKDKHPEKYMPEYYCALDTDDIYELGRNANDPNWFCADGDRKEDSYAKRISL